MKAKKKVHKKLGNFANVILSSTTLPRIFFKPTLNLGAINIQYSSNSSKVIFSVSFKPLFHTIHHLQENTIKTGVYE